MSSGAAVRRYLGSRKNLVGMAGAVVGVGLNLAGVVGDIWPVVAIGLYGVGALVTPADPAPEPTLPEALRAEADALVADLGPRAGALPPGALAAVQRIVAVLGLVLARLDQISDQQVHRAAAPERWAVLTEIVRVDLPACLHTYLDRPPATSQQRAAGEFAAQLDLIAAAVDRLAEDVPDVHAERAEELTRELRRRHRLP